MDVQFLFPKGNDTHAFKIRTTETIEKWQVFARNLKLLMKGEGYTVLEEKEVRLKQGEHVKKMAPLLKVKSRSRHFRYIYFNFLSEMRQNNLTDSCSHFSIQVEGYWDFKHQRDLNKVICAMQMGKVVIGDLKTIQPYMDAADRKVTSVHMGKAFPVGWPNDEVCGKGSFH